MRKILYLLVLISFIACTCKGSSFTKDTQINTQQNILVQGANRAVIQEDDWLIIGGEKVPNYEFNRKHEDYLKSEAETITSVRLYVNPKQSKLSAISLEGIEQLVNLKELEIYGWNLDMVDYSPLGSLKKLMSIEFECGDNYKMTKVPDFSAIAAKDTIKVIYFTKCALTSMNNIEFLPNLKAVNITANEEGPLSNITALDRLQNLTRLEIIGSQVDGKRYHIKDISRLAGLKYLEIHGSLVDLEGIEKLTALERLDFHGSSLENTRGLVNLKKLEELSMTIRDPKPDIGFAKGLASLKKLVIYADDDTWGMQTKEKYQVLDLAPLGNLPLLEGMELRGFILRNAAALDNLENFSGAFVIHSVLEKGAKYPKKNFIFEYDGR